MEENNSTNELKSEVRKHVCFENHCWKKCLAMVLASFLGGFLAFYFVADQIMYRKQMHHRPPHFEKRMFNDIEKMYDKQKHDIDKMFENDMNVFREAFNINKKFKQKMLEEINSPMLVMDSVKIKTEFDDNVFKVIVCLKPFQGDENKINYNVAGRKLTVFGNSQNQDKGFKQDISFSQDFILPESADTAKILKVKDGNKLIISVPMKEQ
ncbi:MAG: Hsp20/alpha crystallin family protein [Candidatus Gastranaerophilales bacterium]|nr:Hsp20/alpha crystallin family protein [Candidatus Gastranaerophilales bacterium]